tara:strand:+ start:1332 stop:1601 length:270 start_codon:yes stop_codon:yes gene_type:complete
MLKQNIRMIRYFSSNRRKEIIKNLLDENKWIYIPYKNNNKYVKQVNIINYDDFSISERNDIIEWLNNIGYYIDFEDKKIIVSKVYYDER